MLEIILKFVGPMLAVLVFFSVLPLLRRNKNVTETGVMILEYGWVLKGVSWFSLFFSIASPIAMYLQEIHDVQEYSHTNYILVAGFFFLCFIYLYIESYYVKFTVTDKTIYCKSPWRKDRSIQINDIVDVGFSQTLKYYKLKTKYGDVVKVYMYMDGVPQFLDFLGEKLSIEIERYY